MTRLIRSVVPFQLRAFALVVLALAVAGCASNPIAIAETPAQKAYAIERVYNIVLEQALEASRNNATIRVKVQAVEPRTTAIVDALSDAFVDYELARAALDTGGDGAAARLATVASNLERWIMQAEEALLELSAAFAD